MEEDGTGDCQVSERLNNLLLPENVCDCHIHVASSFPTLGVSFTLEQLERVMDKYGLAGVLVFSDSNGQHRITSRILQRSRKNDRIHVLLREPPKNYKNPYYIAQMEKQLQKERVVGVKINPSTEGYKVTDGQYSDVLNLLSDYEGVLLVHCGRWVEMSGWDKVISVAKEYSKIKVVMAHMGGTHPDLSYPAIEAASKLRNVYMDMSQTRQPAVLRRGIQTLGPSRILFGSDMPWGSYLQNLVALLELDLSESDLNRILRENFLDLVDGK